MTQHVRIAMNGVTGRMGRIQHLERSLVEIRRRGGVEAADGTMIMPDLVLVGRNEGRLKDLAEQFDVAEWTTDVQGVLADPDIDVYFDSQLTALRAEAVRDAIAAGKAVYCEKPLAETAEEAHALATMAEDAGIKNGIVQDKLFLPGLLKLRKLLDDGFFGRLLSVRIDFGYWVFDGNERPAQRPSWNYRAEDGGSMMLDMFPHWHYVIENLFGAIESVSAIGATHIPVRYEDGVGYEATADDAAYATFGLTGGTIVQVTNSWATRVRRDDLVTFQVDGVDGSAVAGLRNCVAQSASDTPTPVWNPDEASPMSYYDDWMPVELASSPPNAFLAQWVDYLRHIAVDAPFPWGFRSAAKGSDLVDAARLSWSERRWVDLPK